MAGRDVVTELEELKARRGDRREMHVSHDALLDLRVLWETCREDLNVVMDFFPMRAVTLLEVFCREWIARLIDHGAPFLENSAELVKVANLKLDFSVFQAVHRARVTFGELVAYSVSVNSVGDLQKHLSRVLGGDLFEAIQRTHDRVDVEMLGKPAIPIITDVDKLRRALARVYEVRHIVTHEFPATPVYSADEVGPLLEAAVEFVRAAHQTFMTLVYGDYPLKTVDMASVATERFGIAEHELAALYEAVDKTIFDSELLLRSRDAWNTFRSLQAQLRASIVKGGSYEPIVMAQELERLTRTQIARMRWFIERDEQDVF